MGNIFSNVTSYFLLSSRSYLSRKGGFIITTVVILAGGLGTRFKNGVKQLAKVDGKHTLLELSLMNAKKAGFTSFILVIRSGLEDFISYLKKEYKDYDLTFIYQDKEKVREKPLGTGHALYVCKDVIKNPFCIVNADNYYSYKSFSFMNQLLKEVCNDKTHVLVGYPLVNTVSKKGEVNRGICKIENGNLVSIEERLHIPKTEVSKEICSTNFFGFHPSFLEYVKEDFKNFKIEKDNEFLLPSIVENHLSSYDVKVFLNEEKFFEITFFEDVDEIKNYLD